MITVLAIDETVRPLVTTQDYSPKAGIVAVKLIDLRRSVDEGGSFVELARVDPFGMAENIPWFNFLSGQINHSEVEPGAIKAWHLHHLQWDVWYVPPRQRLLVGLWDLRKDSRTVGVKMRFVLGAGQSQLLMIPPRVAHGCANLTREVVDIIYFINRQFDPDNPDEHRLPWDALGADFWEMTKG